jgi:transcriptional regulator with XRE-family HTH domain
VVVNTKKAPQWGVPSKSTERAQLEAFGANVRRERIRLALTQEKLAEKVGLHPRTVQKIEAGETNILLTTVLRFQKALGCNWESLLDRH